MPRNFSGKSGGNFLFIPLSTVILFKNVQYYRCFLGNFLTTCTCLKEAQWKASNDNKKIRKGEKGKATKQKKKV